MWKLLLPGYILTTDMVFGPNYAIPPETPYHSLPFHYLLSVSHNVAPGSVIEKGLLLFVFAFSGIAMYKTVPVSHKYAKYFAGILYVVNPFVYLRFFAGHLTILIAYALLPFVIKAVFDLFSDDGKGFKKAILAALWLTVIGIFSDHLLYISLFVLGMVFVFKLLAGWKKRKNVAMKFAKIIGIFLLLNFWWMISYFITNPIADFSAQHFEAFKTAPDPSFGTTFNVLSMYGFWWEAAPQGDYVVWPKYVIPGAYIIFLLIFTIIVYGIFVSLKEKRNHFVFKMIGLVAIFALIFSIGIGSSYISWFNQFMYDYIPFFSGFRDSQKWSALLILGYCYFGALGIENLIKEKSLIVQKITTYFCCGLVIIYTLPMMAGLGGQIKPASYPESWSEINKILNEDAGGVKVLFLPWHMYMSFEFNNNRLTRIPAPYFFDSEIVAGDNMEIGEIYTTSKNPQSERIATFLKSDEKSDEDLKKLLNDYGFTHIMYVSDTEEIEDIDYSFLFKTQLLRKVYGGDTVFLLKADQE